MSSIVHSLQIAHLLFWCDVVVDDVELFGFAFRTSLALCFVAHSTPGIGCHSLRSGKSRPNHAAMIALMCFNGALHMVVR